MTRVALITEPGHPGLRSDDLSLPAAFEAIGAEAQPLPWGTPWDQVEADLCVIRTPWDYFDRPADFLDWVDAAPMPLLNPAAVLRWNHHKGYLPALQEAGAARIPATAMVAADERPTAADELLDRVTAERAVLKPAVSGGAHQTIVLEPDGTVPWTPEHRGDFLVQAFVDKVEEVGEWSLTCFGGEFSHAVRKTAAKGDFRVQEEHGGRVHVEAPSAALMGAASQVLRGTAELLGLDGPLPYARVDLVEVPYGPPLLMELELIEPELFLRADPEAPGRFARACLDAR